MPKHDDQKTKRLPDAEIAKYHRRLGELTKRVDEGHVEYDGVMRALQGLLDNRKLKVRSLLPSPVEQLRAVKMWNKLCGWGIDDHTFEYFSRPVNMLRCTESDLRPMQAPLLNINLGSADKTITAACSIIEASQFDHTHTLTEDGRYPISSFYGLPVGKSLNWCVVDFGANMEEYSDGPTVSAVRAKAALLPGVEVLWAIAYNPGIVGELREYGVYAIRIGGCSLGDEQIPLVSCGADRQKLEWAWGHIGNGWNRRSVPEFVARENW